MEIKIVRNVLRANDEVAARNRALLRQHGVFTVNLISSPGSGKTTLLERTLEALGEKWRLAIIVGDLATTRDAERIGRYGVPTVQINTEGACHLEAHLVARCLADLDLSHLEVLFIENVGNLVCPVGYDLGEEVKVGLVSVTEGDDKAAKYPRLFREAGCVVVNKTDLLPYVDFSRERFRAEVAAINARVPVLELSCRTGEGLDQWFSWLQQRREQAHQRPAGA
ncbi:MAG TPA: hydrogenase nickel incorporation protein HypB [Armatimonadetes bacterium]|nr:hydrogenase nickel incorporation protein HypB [Armatimonadota bacterium]